VLAGSLLSGRMTFCVIRRLLAIGSAAPSTGRSRPWTRPAGLKDGPLFIYSAAVPTPVIKYGPAFIKFVALSY
jgi:hypothetical protein